MVHRWDGGHPDKVRAEQGWTTLSSSLSAQCLFSSQAPNSPRGQQAYGQPSAWHFYCLTPPHRPTLHTLCQALGAARQEASPSPAAQPGCTAKNKGCHLPPVQVDGGVVSGLPESPCPIGAGSRFARHYSKPQPFGPWFYPPKTGTGMLV